jgi:hypothetical protein
MIKKTSLNYNCKSREKPAHKNYYEDADKEAQALPS